MTHPLVVIDTQVRKHYITIDYIVDVVQGKNAKHCKIYTVSNVINVVGTAKEIVGILERGQSESNPIIICSLLRFRKSEKSMYM